MRLPPNISVTYRIWLNFIYKVYILNLQYKLLRFKYFKVVGYNGAHAHFNYNAYGLLPLLFGTNSPPAI
ncbi:hypothetical protein DJ568_05545 [Mucilaginibacter hurinus]|uniref:Uncharacterized protein n=1 Tax=Mucilaginibacter hurinus TaxID=2201324 RepID=A0A367GSH7_9SPHI|nr:hypothetical protein DJ568_05545 [Mucilaginibacter hurinus]